MHNEPSTRQKLRGTISMPVKTVKRHIFKAAQSLRAAWGTQIKRLSYRRFIRLKPLAAERLADSPISLYTIGFNCSKVLALQIKALEKNAEGEWKLTIIDNSINPEASSEIRTLAQSKRVGYVRLPLNPMQTSESHGLALDWTLKNIVLKSSCKVVGILDHDIFPLRPVDLDSILHGCVAHGLPQTRGATTYYWPGFLFLKKESLSLFPVSFFPEPGLDTGAGTRRLISSGMPVSFASHRQISLEQHSNNSCTSAQTSAIELIDNAWLHLINGSGWQGGTTKLDLLELRTPETAIRFLSSIFEEDL